MQESPEPVLEETLGQTSEVGPDTDPEKQRDRRFRIAMAAYAILAALIWFTVGEGTVIAFGRRVEIRLIPLLIIGLFAFRTYLAREADKIRRRSGSET